MSQADPTPKTAYDPFELWRQFYEANEQAWSKTIKEVTTTTDYAEAQGKLLESMLAFQKMMRDNMSAQLNAVNLPTRDDVSRIGELVLSLEEKIDQLDDKVPANIVERLSALEKRVEKFVALEKAIEAIDQRLEKMSDRLPERVARQVQKEVEAAVPEPDKGLEKAIEAIDQRLENMSDRLPARVARQVQKEAEAAVPEPDKSAKPRARAK